MTGPSETPKSDALDRLDGVISEESAEALHKVGITTYNQLRSVRYVNLSKAMQNAEVENPMKVIEKIVDELRDKGLLHSLSV